LLVWKEEYAIGVESIDNQHKHLFEIGNSIYELLENYVLEDKYDRIINVLNDLREYTKYHFQSEEDYMIEIMYSGYFKQKVEHEDFIDKIEEIQLQDLDENQEKHIRELLLFVFNWILEHILQRDKLITA